MNAQNFRAVLDAMRDIQERERALYAEPRQTDESCAWQAKCLAGLCEGDADYSESISDHFAGAGPGADAFRALLKGVARGDIKQAQSALFDAVARRAVWESRQ